MAFHIPYINWLKSEGYEVHVAANDGATVIAEADKQYNIPIDRRPFSFQNIKATRLLTQIMKAEKYDLIHCHTAMGSVTARFAARTLRQSGLKVLYTAHGFHFYKGSPKKYWMLYYPMEKFLSRFTDGIVTINREDYQLLIDKKFKSPYKFQINGIGVKSTRFVPVSVQEKSDLRLKLGYNSEQFILIYVAEFIHRKNHQFILDSITDLASEIPNLKVLFAGRGQLLEQMKGYAHEQGLAPYVDFLGFRTDIENVIQIADVGISASRQEGLGLNLIEEMFCGLPIVATVDRGHKEIVEDGKNGFFFNQNSKEEFINSILKLHSNTKLRLQMGENALKFANKFTLKSSLEQMAKIYNQFLKQ